MYLGLYALSLSNTFFFISPYIREHYAGGHGEWGCEAAPSSSSSVLGLAWPRGVASARETEAADAATISPPSPYPFPQKILHGKPSTWYTTNSVCTGKGNEHALVHCIVVEGPARSPRPGSFRHFLCWINYLYLCARLCFTPRPLLPSLSLLIGKTLVSPTP